MPKLSFRRPARRLIRRLNALTDFISRFFGSPTRRLLLPGMLILLGTLVFDGRHLLAQGENQDFLVYGETFSDWDGDVNRSYFGVPYTGQADYGFDSQIRSDGPSADNFATSRGRYTLQTLGASFGTRSEVSVELHQSELVRTFGRSSARGKYKVPFNENSQRSVEWIQAIIPIHGSVGLFDGASGLEGKLRATAAWSFSLHNEDYSQTYYEGDGFLRFDSDYGAPPELITRTGSMAAEGVLDITAFGDRLNPLLGNDSLQGFDVNGFVIAQSIVRVRPYETFFADFSLQTSVVTFLNENGFLYGEADFFNTATMELRGLDADGVVIEGLVFTPVAVPEPSGAGCAIVMLGILVRRRRRRH